MRFLFCLTLMAFSFVTLCAQQHQVVLFPLGAPGREVALVEKVDSSGVKTGGRTVARVTDVDTPTLTFYPVASQEPTAVVVVCPGGGYSILAYDLEGTEICRWLNEQGVAAALLKYRVPRRNGCEKHVAPLQDLQRAFSYLRFHATDLNIDPLRIGTIGFSAGAHLTVMAACESDRRSYPVVDNADTVSLEPNFSILVYPAYLDGKDPFSLAPEIRISKKIPPTLIVQAQDDSNYINSSLFYYYALKQQGVPVTMHLYPHGGHGFGLRTTMPLVNQWPDRVKEWMHAIGVIK